MHAEVQGLRDCMRSHFPVVRAHVEAEVEKKIAETGGSSFPHLSTAAVTRSDVLLNAQL